MFSHVMIGSNNIERSKAFYDAVIAVLGGGEGMLNTASTGHRRLFYRHQGSSFGITQPINGEPATVANGSTLGFKCDSEAQLLKFHEVAVAHGGTAIEDAPGLRSSPMGDMYLAYVRDPDGHKLCAIYRP
ncbi:VOC family protein [Pokkaliibacter sp. CJK22405]|uniref:VOC family protein n=1 Tax=Pokkaliibacter sp. CJK22405 TaxID=3384615 RepID=UPI0039846C78